jgi:hypothetical protein
VFEAQWGNELILLTRTYAALGIPYPWERIA